MGLISKLRLRAPRLRRTTTGARIRRRDDRLRVLLDVARRMEPKDLRDLMLKLGEASATLLAADQGLIHLHDEVTGELFTASTEGPGERRRTLAEAGAAGFCFQTGQVTEASARAAAGVDGLYTLHAPLRELDAKSIGVVEVLRRRPFGEEDRVAIELLAEHAAVAIQRYRLQQAAVQGFELKREMELAKRVQEALLPASPPSVLGLEALGWTRPASLTGGDCFDLWALPDGRLAVFVGDASGHGMAAALVISQVRAMLRALCEIQTDPLRLLERINARLAQDLGDGRFVTAFFGCISPQGLLRWSSAGQGPILVRTSGVARFQLFQAPAVPLGVASDLIADAVPAIRLEPGGMLAAMTDGVFEAANAEGELFGASRVGEILDQNGDQEPATIQQRLQEAIRAWQGRDEPLDDQTIVLVRRSGPVAAKVLRFG